MNQQQGIKTDKIARIWENEDGTFIVCDFDNYAVSIEHFKSDADARQYAKDHGFEEIFWME